MTEGLVPRSAWLTGGSAGIEKAVDPAPSSLEFEAYSSPSHLPVNWIRDDE
jgi:hypothetical protein